MIVYENHLGGIYLEDERVPFEELYCEQCGDSDWELGQADTFEELLELLTEEDCDGEPWLPYDIEYLEQFRMVFEEDE